MESVSLEAVEPAPIIYKRGNFYQKLDGYNAFIYRLMIGVYGKPIATEKFWWLWHKKEVSAKAEYTR